MRPLFACLMLILAISGASAEDGLPSAPSSDGPKLKAQILKCFLPSSEATGRVVVAFDADATGAVRNARAVSGGATDGEKALVAAGIRAIFRCSPYQLREAGEVRVAFEMPQAADQAAAQAEAAEAEASYALQRFRSGMLEGVPLRFEVPEGFCPLDPQGDVFDRKLWKHFTPAKERNARLVTMDIDCETLTKGRANGRLVRPQRMLQLMGAARDSDLPPELGNFLAAIHARFVRLHPPNPRFWENPPIAGSPVTGLDEYAVYEAQRGLNRDGSIALAGIVAFTLLHDKQLILSRMEFGGRNLTDDMPGSMMRAVKSLHDLSR